MKLSEIYTAILSFAGMQPDANGLINEGLDSNLAPALVNGLRLVMPTDDQLRSYNPKEKMVFHPLAENILRGESEVLIKLKGNINVRLNFVIGVLGQHLLNLAASPELHKQLSPEQSELVAALPDVDERTVTNFVSMMVQRIKQFPDRVFINVYLKKGGRVGEKKHAKAGIITFPFYNELAAAGEGKMDKLRVKDVQMFKKLFEYMFANIADKEAYNYGSDDPVAPFLAALLVTTGNVASLLNDTVNLFADYVEEPETLKFNMDWFPSFENLEALAPEIRRIPVQFGNDGSLSVTAVEREPVPEPRQVAAPVYTPQPQPQQQQMPVPALAVPAAPELRVTDKGIDFRSLKQIAPGLQPQQPMQMSMLPNGGMQVPQMVIPHPVTQQPMLVPAPQQPQMMYDPRMQQQPMMQPQMQPQMITQPMYDPRMMPMNPGMQVPMVQMVDQRTGQMVLVPAQQQQPMNNGGWTDPYRR